MVTIDGRFLSALFVATMGIGHFVYAGLFMEDVMLREFVATRGMLWFVILFVIMEGRG